MNSTQCGILFVVIVQAAPAFAQLDPLLFVKTTQPRILLAVDTSSRMQRDAPADPSNSERTSSYYDPFIYPKLGSVAEATLGVTPANTVAFYRRRYDGLVAASERSPDAFDTIFIQITGDRSPEYSSFDAPTRLAVVRAALYQAIVMNQSDADFGLIKMRQSAPTSATLANSGPVADSSAAQSAPGTTEIAAGLWSISRPQVAGPNAVADSSTALLVKADSPSSNQDVQAVLLKDTRTGGALLPAAQDTAAALDAPIAYLLEDARAEATRLIRSQPSVCTNTIVVLVTGGGEGATAPGPPDPAAIARTFLDVAGHRVPIYVLAIAPPVADIGRLRAIAAASGGQYFEIGKSQIDAALASPTLFPSPIDGTVVVPELVHAVNMAVQHGLALAVDVNMPPTADRPLGPLSEFQTAHPVIGTVNLDNASDISGHVLPNSIVTDTSRVVIPQRSNVIVTAGFTLPGFHASLRAFRQYQPIPDATTASGWRFESDRTPLWVAVAPEAAKRNLYTARPEGTIVPFTEANAGELAPLMNLSLVDARSVIAAVRQMPLGAVIDSTPAVMNPPSLDPPPDAAYQKFVADNKRRRDIIWVGTNAGWLEAIDARLGVEVWGYVPLNLLPKLKALWLGHGFTEFGYFVDGSPKIADVKVDGSWRTHLIVGEGPGGVFYQSFDVTLTGMTDVDRILPDSDDIDAVLRYFADSGRITLNWAFPRYTSFDPRLSFFDADANRLQSVGDLKASASAIEKTVGQTWSDPAVGQVGGALGPFAVMVGSGFLPRTTELQPNRLGTVAGTTFYVLSAKDGRVYASADVGSDGRSEDIDNCGRIEIGAGDPHAGKRARTFSCETLKNALQADPAATGPSTSRFTTKAYIGDLDGRIWRFDLALDARSEPIVAATTNVLPVGVTRQPVFGSMSLVNVGGASPYVFYGTGSDLLPAPSAGTRFQLAGFRDDGPVETRTFTWSLAPDEHLAGSPVIAGDAVFFTTTEFDASGACSESSAQLLAFSYAGGAAFDTDGDGHITAVDRPLVGRVRGARATAPFVADKHLVFGAGSTIAQIGEPKSFNSGVGQARLRVLSWRELR